MLYLRYINLFTHEYVYLLKDGMKAGNKQLISKLHFTQHNTNRLLLIERNHIAMISRKLEIGRFKKLLADTPGRSIGSTNLTIFSSRFCVLLLTH